MQVLYPNGWAPPSDHESWGKIFLRVRHQQRCICDSCISSIWWLIAHLLQFPWLQCLRNSMHFGTMRMGNSKSLDYHEGSVRTGHQSVRRKFSPMRKFGIDCAKPNTHPRTVYAWLVSRTVISFTSCNPCMLEMEKDTADCVPLLEITTSALGEEAMQMLLISTQRTNMALCVKYAVEK